MSTQERGQPTQWDVAWREGYAKGLEHAKGLPYLQAWSQAVDTAQNARGEWVPAIPLPLFVWPHRHRCECGRSSWTMSGYRGHYAESHILYPPATSAGTS